MIKVWESASALLVSHEDKETCDNYSSYMKQKCSALHERVICQSESSLALVYNLLFQINCHVIEKFLYLDTFSVTAKQA